MAETEIKVIDSGPYLVSVPLRLLDADGNKFETEQEITALCRCGHSENKPFCDGSHKKHGFVAVERAGK